MITNRHEPGQDAGADSLAADVLAWIAADENRMGRFLALTGLSVDNLRQSAQDPGFSRGVLSFLMGHEPALMEYCSDHDVDPETIVRVWQHLHAGEET